MKLPRFKIKRHALHFDQKNGTVPDLVGSNRNGLIVLVATIMCFNRRVQQILRAHTNQNIVQIYLN